jgi:hypothetical protein
MSAYGSPFYYGNPPMPLQQASWDANAMVNPYTGIEDARYINTHPSVVASAGAVPVEPHQVGPFQLPPGFTQDQNAHDALKAGVGLSGLVLLWVLLTRQPAKTTPSAWDRVWQWIKNPLAKPFKDDQNAISILWAQGLGHATSRKKYRQLSRKMTAEGGTAFVQNAINYLKDDYGKNGWHRMRNAHASENKREQAFDVMRLLRELMRDPTKDKLFEPDLHLEFGFKTHAEAVHQTQSILRALIENYRRCGLTHNEKVQTLTNISEEFLKTYIERHKVDPTNYPMGEGTALLSRLVHLPKIKSLIYRGWLDKDARKLEAERALREFLYIASNVEKDYAGETHTSPIRLFKPDEWKSFIQEYKTIMAHKLQNNRENNKLFEALDTLAKDGYHALNQQGTDDKQVRIRKNLTQAVTALLRQSRNTTSSNVGGIVDEIEGKHTDQGGQTFELLLALLQELHPQMDHLHSMA